VRTFPLHLIPTNVMASWHHETKENKRMTIDVALVIIILACTFAGITFYLGIR